MPKTVKVKPYKRKDGTKIPRHLRNSPRKKIVKKHINIEESYDNIAREGKKEFLLSQIVEARRGIIESQNNIEYYSNLRFTCDKKDISKYNNQITNLKKSIQNKQNYIDFCNERIDKLE